LAWVSVGFGSGPKPKPKTRVFLGLKNSEFDSIHFGVEIKKNNFMSAKNFLGVKYFEISLKFCEVPNYTFDVFVCPSVCL